MYAMEADFIVYLMAEYAEEFSLPVPAQSLGGYMNEELSCLRSRHEPFW